VLSDVDSEHEDDIEDSLSWDESDPESNEVSDSYSEIRASESDSEEKQDGDSREILGKDGYVWPQKPKAVRTPMRNIRNMYRKYEGRTESHEQQLFVK